MVPLSLRAYKGEGEKKQRQRLALMRQPLPLVWYWGGEGIAHPSPDSSRGIGMTGGRGRLVMVEDKRASPRSYFEWPQHGAPAMDSGSGLE